MGGERMGFAWGLAGVSDAMLDDTAIVGTPEEAGAVLETLIR